MLLAGSLLAQDFRPEGTNIDYREGDWISYSVGRFVSSIAIGQQYIYFGTEFSGIARLDQYSMDWQFPWTTSNGLADNRITAVAYDFDTSQIWGASTRAVSVYNPASQKWLNFYKSDNGLSENDDILSIGIGDDNVYFEARSGAIIEVDKFGSFARRGDTLPSNLSWFGRRGLTRRELPHFFMSGGYTFTPGKISSEFDTDVGSTMATIQDFDFRTSPIVAAVDDKWGNLWLASWGAGVGKADVRTLRLEIMEFGLGTPIVEALTFHDNMLWIGGAQYSDRINGAGFPGL